MEGFRKHFSNQANLHYSSNMLRNGLCTFLYSYSTHNANQGWIQDCLPRGGGGGGNYNFELTSNNKKRSTLPNGTKLTS